MDDIPTFCRYLASAYGCGSVRFIHIDDVSESTLTHACRPLVLHGVNGDRLSDAAIPVAFTGQGVAILDPNESRHAPGTKAPPHFVVLAIVPTFNEADIIHSTLDDLVSQGLQIHVLDNWSTDDTFEIARTFEGSNACTVERFPAHGPCETYDLHAVLARVEDVAEAHGADWTVLHDADERRRSPWRDVALRDALWHADQCGFSCIDHVTLNYWPVDNGFDPRRADLEDYFEYFEFSDHPGHFHQRRAWRRSGVRVSLAANAGHDVMFPGRRVYPYKFLLKHYPIRSQEHGERKVLRERVARWNAQERAQGWHRQYEGMDTRSFLREKSSLTRFEPLSFASDYLIPRLSGVGIFASAPPWATAPCW